MSKIIMDYSTQRQSRIIECGSFINNDYVKHLIDSELSDYIGQQMLPFDKMDTRARVSRCFDNQPPQKKGGNVNEEGDADIDLMNEESDEGYSELKEGNTVILWRSEPSYEPKFEIEQELTMGRIFRIQNDQNTYLTVNTRSLLTHWMYRRTSTLYFEVLRYLFLLLLILRKLIRFFIKSDFYQVAIILFNTVDVVFTVVQEYNNKSVNFNDLFLRIYTIELAMILITYGPLSSRPFYKNVWLYLDIIYIAFNWIALIPGFIYFDSKNLVIIKVVRLLKIFGFSQTFKNHFKYFFKFINYFLDFGLIFLVFFCLFSVTGTSLFHEVTHKKCLGAQAEHSDLHCLNDSVCPTDHTCQHVDTTGHSYFSGFFIGVVHAFSFSIHKGWYHCLTTSLAYFPLFFKVLLVLNIFLYVFVGKFVIINFLISLIISNYQKSKNFIESAKFRILARIKEIKHHSFSKLKLARLCEDLFVISNQEDEPTSSRNLVADVRSFFDRQKKRVKPNAIFPLQNTEKLPLDLGGESRKRESDILRRRNPEFVFLDHEFFNRNSKQQFKGKQTNFTPKKSARFALKRGSSNDQDVDFLNNQLKIRRNVLIKSSEYFAKLIKMDGLRSLEIRFTVDNQDKSYENIFGSSADVLYKPYFIGKEDNIDGYDFNVPSVIQCIDYNFSEIDFEHRNQMDLLDLDFKSDHLFVRKGTRDGLVRRTGRMSGGIEPLRVLRDYDVCLKSSLNRILIETCFNDIALSREDVGRTESSLRNKELKVSVTRSMIDKTLNCFSEIKLYFKNEREEVIGSKGGSQDERLDKGLELYKSIKVIDLLNPKEVLVWSGHQALRTDSISKEEVVGIALSVNQSQLLVNISTRFIFRNAFFSTFTKGLNGFYTSSHLTNIYNLIILTEVVLKTITNSLIEADARTGLLKAILVLDFFFIVEIVLRIVYYSFNNTRFRSKDAFDCICVVFSSFNIIYLLLLFNGSSVPNVIVYLNYLTLFRIFNVYPLLNISSLISKSLRTILALAKSPLIFSLVLFLIFTLGGYILFNNDLPRFVNGVEKENFNNLSETIYYLFNIMIFDNWDIAFENFGNINEPSSLKYGFLFSWTIISGVLIMSLLVGVILDSFGSIKVADLVSNSRLPLYSFIEKLKGQRDEHHRLQEEKERVIIKRIEEYNIFDVKLNEKSKLHLLRETVFANELENFYSDKSKTSYNVKGIENKSESLKFKKFSVRKSPLIKAGQSVVDYSLFLFSSDSSGRRMVDKVVRSWYFGLMVGSSIMGNFLLIIYFSYCRTTHMNDNSSLNVVDRVINAVLLLEIVLRSIANGFVIGRSAYVKSPLILFNVVSTLIIFIDVYFSPGWTFVIYLKILRFFNIIQILWNVKRLRKNLKSLERSFNVLKYFLFINVPVLVFFSLLGFALFKNKLGYCFDTVQVFGVGRGECIQRGHRWIIPGWNFDSIFNSIATVYTFSMNDYLSLIFFSVWDSEVDSTGAVYRGFFLGVIYFYSVFIIVNLLGYTVGIGLIWSEFKKDKLKERTDVAVSEEEKVFLSHLEFAQKVPNVTFSSFAKKTVVGNRLLKVSQTDACYLVTSLLYVFSMVLLTVDNGSNSEYKTNVLRILNIFVSVTLILVLGLKMLIQGSHLFRNIKNYPLVLLMIFTIVDFVALSWNHIDLIMYTRIFRVTRFVLIEQIFQMRIFEKFRLMTLAIMKSIPECLGLILSMFCLYFFYAIIGTNYFGETMPAYYREFHNSLLTMIRISTGEGWFMIMFELMPTHNPYFIFLYFASFTFLTTYLLFNLFVLITLEQLEFYYFDSHSHYGLFQKRFKHFETVWSIYSQRYFKEYIHENDIVNFFVSLNAPNGVFTCMKFFKDIDLYEKEFFNLDIFYGSLECQMKFVEMKVAELQVPVRNRLVGYKDLLLACTHLSVKLYSDKREFKKNAVYIKYRRTFEKRLCKKQKTDPTKRVFSSPVIFRIFSNYLLSHWIQYSVRSKNLH